jgi:hypothetical protein
MPNMNLKHPKRKRGLILTPDGWQKFYEAKLKLEFEENAGNKFTLQELSRRTELDPATISKIMARIEGVDKRSLSNFFHAFGLELLKSDCNNATRTRRQDWGEALAIPEFYGRSEELTTLAQWLSGERCQLVVLLGMGGIGKTSLSIKMAQHLQDSFECVIWRSLQDAPLAEDLLTDIIRWLSEEVQALSTLRTSLAKQILQLIEHFREHRCLLILDNVDSIMCDGERAGQYRTGYEGYGELLSKIGGAAHRSCLFLTSREKPKEVALLEGEFQTVRSFLLNGVSREAGQNILRSKGLTASETAINTLIDCYAGNPLAMKMAATTIQTLFNGHVLDFLQYQSLVFGDFYELMRQQFERLSDPEQEIMYWLAINREPVPFSKLQADIVSPMLEVNLIEAIESLSRRSLIEKKASLFTLQPVVMEYVTRRLVEQVRDEISPQQPILLRRHALIGLLSGAETD